MVIDEDLLAKARAAAGKLAEREREALLSRADYHAAIRRLHLAGGSLREIAQALGLSHQRVQQIVDQAGGSWWQRVWRTRKPARDAVCTFCGRPPSEVAKLLAGPNVYICDGCVERATRKFTASKKARCAFCGGRSGDERRVFSAAQASVCTACLKQCREILA